MHAAQNRRGKKNFLRFFYDLTPRLAHLIPISSTQNYEKKRLTD